MATVLLGGLDSTQGLPLLITQPLAPPTKGFVAMAKKKKKEAVVYRDFEDEIEQSLWIPEYSRFCAYSAKEKVEDAFILAIDLSRSPAMLAAFLWCM